MLEFSARIRERADIEGSKSNVAMNAWDRDNVRGKRDETNGIESARNISRHKNSKCLAPTISFVY